MGVAGNELGAASVERLQIVDRLAEGGAGLRTLQVADVLAEEHLVPDRQGDRVLQVGATPDDAGEGGVQVDRQRRIAPGAAQHQLAPLHHARDGVVHVAADRPVVDQKQIGDAPQTLERLPFAGADRLFRQVSAGGHDRLTEVAHQQMVQRRAGQHDPEKGVVRRHVEGEVVPAVASQQDDRRLGRAEQAFFQGRELAVGGDAGKIRIHQGKGLLFPVLESPEPRNRRLVHARRPSGESRRAP